MNYQELNGKSLALLLAGEDEDWSVLRGTLRLEGEVLLIDRTGGEQPFVIQPEWLDRIKSVSADLSDILIGADYFLPLSVGALPEDAASRDYIHSYRVEIAGVSADYRAGSITSCSS